MGEKLGTESDGKQPITSHELPVTSYQLPVKKNERP